MSRERHIQRPPPIVFEGNRPAEVSKNPLLNRLLEAAEWPEAPRADYAWLGDAIAIKDPTAIVFRPQSGSNVLIVGQNDEAALAMMMMATLSIAAQHPPVGPQASRFYLLTAVRSIPRWPTARLAQGNHPPPCHQRNPGGTCPRPSPNWPRSSSAARRTPPTIRPRSSSSSTTSSGSATSASRTTISGTRGMTRTSPPRRRSSSATSCATARPSASTPSSGATASTT